MGFLLILVLVSAEVPQKGLNFAVTPKAVPVNEIIAAIDQACLQIQNKMKADHLRGDVANTLKRAKPPKPNISVGRGTRSLS